MRFRTVWRPLQVVVAAALASALSISALAVAGFRVAPAQAESPCPDGFRLVDAAEIIVEQTMGGGEEAPRPVDQMLKPMCLNNKHPESFSEISTMQAQRSAAVTGGLGTAPRGKFRAALAQKARLAAAASVPGDDGKWKPLGDTPLLSNVEGYSTSTTGLNKLNGRIDSLDFDPQSERLFASIGTGGVWMSTNYGDSWKSIGDSLPTQTIGAVAWSPAKGGTLIAVSGEPLMGGNTYTGLGAYYSRNLGKTWRHADGIRDGLMGFQVEVDPTDPSTVYVATSMGLYRSTDAGETFRNVNLPVGDGCAGNTKYNRCQFANFVTDVVVKEPGGTTNEAGGEVVAAVGYRAGLAQFPNGETHAPGNGIYGSDTGAPGSFERLGDPTDQQNLGRMEFGNAVGDAQNHNYLYVIVEDAELFNGGVPSIDAPEPGLDDQGLYNTSFNGIYVSSDFGQTWTQMADTAEVAENPTTHSGLSIVGQATLFAPGVQAWYNMWIKPDPTQQDNNGVPTELTFGLEEVWKNRCVNPQNTAQQNVTCDLADLDPFDNQPDVELGDFEVVGPYFADSTCLLLDFPTNQCVTAEGFTNVDDTTHPDQHDALYVPNDDGGSKLIIGNDGGAYVQDVPDGELPDDRAWGQGDNDGFHTLLPYNAEVSKDDTVWYGLQDNGSGKITPGGKQIMAFGGDGLFVAVDPNNSDYAWSETPNAAMRVTTDGGKTWRYAAPPVSSPQFSNPFVMDPTDANHLLTAGRQVVETTHGPDTAQYDPSDTFCLENCWETVFDLGTRDNPGETPDDTAGTPVGDESPENRMSTVELQGDAAYVGFCGVCDVLNNWDDGFNNGIATNVGGDQPPKRMTSQGWHIAKAKGLPNRFITSIAIDPKNVETIFVTLGGYANREWVPEGSYLDKNKNIGSGNVFMSTDAGDSFTNISGSLPDTMASWVEVQGDQLLVGTDIGVFLSGPIKGVGGKSASGFSTSAVNAPEWAPLDDGLPAVPISSIRNHPGKRDTVIVATFGRGVYSYSGLPPAPGDEEGDDGTGGDDGRGGVGDTGDGRDLPATGGGMVLVGVLSMTLGGLIAGLSGMRKRRRR